MLLITNKKLADILAQSEYFVREGAQKLENRRHIQQGVREINQGLGGIKTIQRVLCDSVEAKTFNVNY